MLLTFQVHWNQESPRSCCEHNSTQKVQEVPCQKLRNIVKFGSSFLQGSMKLLQQVKTFDQLLMKNKSLYKLIELDQCMKTSSQKANLFISGSKTRTPWPRQRRSHPEVRTIHTPKSYEVTWKWWHKIWTSENQRLTKPNEGHKQRATINQTTCFILNLWGNKMNKFHQGH